MNAVTRLGKGPKKPEQRRFLNGLIPRPPLRRAEREPVLACFSAPTAHLSPTVPEDPRVTRSDTKGAAEAGGGEERSDRHLG